MKIVSFNINGVRARLHQLEALFAKHDPDIVGLQEIKVHDDAFPAKFFREAGYHVSWHGQKSHYGVALVSKTEPTAVEKNLPDEPADAQRRAIIGTWETGAGKLTVVNGYFPQGESRNHPVKFPYKQAFYEHLQSYLARRHTHEDNLVVLGDMNISPTDLDIGIGADNAKRWLRAGKCSFLPEEREWMARLEGWGLTDSFRAQHPEVNDRFSWFDYRSRGFEAEPKRGLRIDLIMLTRSLMERCRETGIDYELRGMEKPSDHAPIWASLEV
ncbi:MAG: exodeoxyribonuclease III [Acidobacteriota bacterium]|nr:exodeoxyribonuclease III [Acidobacteriota bacterium]